jgi:epoxide hydrolase-like predicted phosphatase
LPALTVPRAEGLLIDAGGVLTTDLFASFDAWCARAGLGQVSFLQLYRESPELGPLLHRLELGELGHEEVEPELARLIGLPPDRAEGLFAELYRDVRLVPETAEAVETLHERGVRTGLLSNSWWFPIYDDPFYARAFDAQLLSGRCGVRKPERRMFELGLEALGVPAEQTVFVDDFEENLRPAAALGMTVVLHDPADPGRTARELGRLFSISPEAPRDERRA